MPCTVNPDCDGSKHYHDADGEWHVFSPSSRTLVVPSAPFQAVLDAERTKREAEEVRTRPERLRAEAVEAMKERLVQHALAAAGFSFAAAKRDELDARLGKLKTDIDALP